MNMKKEAAILCVRVIFIDTKQIVHSLEQELSVCS